MNYYNASKSANQLFYSINQAILNHDTRRLSNSLASKLMNGSLVSTKIFKLIWSEYKHLFKK
jgi:predicted nuclease of restriction endonuclease-like (RecB) superfamily